MQSEVTHGVTAVAELKLDADLYLPKSWDGHPRRHRRGRIEAQVPPPRPSPATPVTHGVTAVAELKPAGMRSMAADQSSSPTASPPWPN